MPHKHLLILGGTGEAAELARRAYQVFGTDLKITVSYAGVTGHQPDLPCVVRVGGFGGEDGLAHFIEHEKIDLLIDATHPFAHQISLHAFKAAEKCKCQALIYNRPAWNAEKSDQWIMVKSLQGAVQKVQDLGLKCFLTIGIKELAAFETVKNVPLVVRLINEPDHPLKLENYELVLSRPPYDLAQERTLLEEHHIEVIVSKNSGGAQTFAKIEAARHKRIPVIMIERPVLQDLAVLENLDEVLDWIKGQLVAPLFTPEPLVN